MTEPLNNIELPAFAIDGTQEQAPTTGQQADGWDPGDQPPAQTFNWLNKRTYDTTLELQRRSERHLAPAQGLALQHWGFYGLLSESSGSFARAVEVDSATGEIVIAHADTTSTYTGNGITTSNNARVLFTRRASGLAGLSWTPRLVAISPGVFACAFASNIQVMYSLASNFTTWALNAAGPSGSNGFVATDMPTDYAICNLDGASSMVLVGGSYLYHHPADVAPSGTFNTNFTNLDLSSLGFTSSGVRTSIAANDDYIVIVGDDGAGNGLVAWAPTSAGGVIGDWTVDAATFAGKVLTSVVWNGTVFVVINAVNGGVSWTDSPNPADSTYGGWAPAQTACTSGGNIAYILKADPVTGLIVAHGTGNATYWASSDGQIFSRIVQAASEPATATAVTAQQGSIAIDPITHRVFAVATGLIMASGV